MEYIYAAMLLHSAKQEVNEANVSKVLEATGLKADNAKIKALIASLKDVNIDEAIEKASAMQAVAVAPVAAQSGETAKKEKETRKEEDKKTEEEAAEGLAGLFG